MRALFVVTAAAALAAGATLAAGTALAAGTTLAAASAPATAAAARTASSAHASSAPARSPRPDDAARHIAILCYHDVSDDPAAPLQSVSAEFLRNQIRRCRAGGWTFVSIADLLAHRRHPDELPWRAIALTFDDGYESFRERALPILREEGVPATLAVISGFVDRPPAGSPPMMSWSELSELSRDPLVTIASHTHALHRYDTCDPYRDTAPSVAARRYVLADARYENREEYRARVRADLDTARRVITERLGRAPDVLVWPYGVHNEMARGLADQMGFTATLALGGREVTPDDLRQGCLPRFMVTRTMPFGAGDAAWLTPPAAPIRAADVDLDDVYSPDPAELRDRVDQLMRRVKALGATHVFLSVCSDTTRQGRFETAWCMNHQVRVRADVWSMVASKLAQARLKVWARVPTMNLTWAWQQHPEWRIATDPATARSAAARPPEAAAGRDRTPAEAWPTRLSPDLPESRRAAIDFLTDLAVYAPIDGVVFDDDAALAPDEHLALSRESGARGKADAIDDLLARSRDAVRAWRPECKFGRVVGSRVAGASGVEPEVAQDFARIVRDDDITIVRVPAGRLDGRDASRPIELATRRALDRWRAATRAKAGATAPVMFAIQALDRGDGRWLPGHAIDESVAAARRAGARQVAVGPVTPDAGDLPPGLLETPPPHVATGE